ncbi:MAG: tetratricopeptide repeat protein [Syntrophaceae bacterium]|nr:tetratricopeptide repeat protein [Syntrophaceae bacterium]
MINPDFAEGYSNRGVALYGLNKFEEAIASCDRAIALNPGLAASYVNKGQALFALKHYDEAEESYDRAIALEPDFAEAHFNKSLSLLSVGKYSGAWAEFEWRWKMRKFTSPRRNFSQPVWLGSGSINGRTILLHTEQGLGDTFQFCRYVKLVADFGAKVILEAEQSLIELLKQMDYVTGFVSKGDELPVFDVHCPLMSLPLAFNTTIETIPFTSKYLSCDSEKLGEWARRLGRKIKPRIGLVWSGNKGNTKLLYRSLPFSELTPLLSNEFQFVSLQQEIWENDRPTFQTHPEIVHYGDELRDFTDTAALCELMDMVITIDTSVAHLSAAMGRPTRIMLPFTSDWRWMFDGDDAPWYESARLYRQPERGDWQSVVARVSADLLKQSW